MGWRVYYPGVCPKTDKILRRVFRRGQCARPEVIECRVWACQVRNRCRYKTGICNTPAPEFVTPLERLDKGND